MEKGAWEMGRFDKRKEEQKTIAPIHSPFPKSVAILSSQEYRIFL